MSSVVRSSSPIHRDGGSPVRVVGPQGVVHKITTSPTRVVGYSSMQRTSGSPV